MKISEIKKAYDTVSADERLKEKIFSQLETEETEVPIPLETSQINLKKGGGFKKTVTALCAAAAVFAAVIIGRIALDRDIIQDDPPAVSGSEVTSAPEITEIPPNTAVVRVKVVDRQDGTFIKNLRVDYLPVIITEEENINPDWYDVKTTFDMEKMDRAGTIPMTYERSTEVLIPYGDYLFVVSNALPNAETRIDRYTHENEEHENLYIYDGSSSVQTLVTIDESTTEIVLTSSKRDAEYNSSSMYSKVGITLQDANGDPLPDYTVILQPADGKMAGGYNDKYGGYVLTRTNAKGEAFWRSQYPVEGDYIVIAYREELHPISEPILEPFVFDGDNTFSYTYRETVFITDKTFKEVPKKSQ